MFVPPAIHIRENFQGQIQQVKMTIPIREKRGKFCPIRIVGCSNGDHGNIVIVNKEIPLKHVKGSKMP